MENYQKLKEVIQAANPEIMELKFGCELEGGFIYSWSNGPLSWVISQNGGGTQIQIPNVDDYKILGRPIRLADVLLAIASELPRSDSYFVDADGGFHEWFSPKGRLDLRTVANWNLKDDNLDHQPDETKQFLINLLVGSQ